MKIKQLFESIRIGADEKARRVLNVSRRKASITAEEIENGVTLERLSDIGVPVLRYSSQVTIHGELPDFNPEARPAGYKAVVRNQNGSVGVRYVAIDAQKKQRIVEASREAREAGWSASLTSTGLTVSRCLTDKEACIAAFREFPQHLFYGSLSAFEGVFGGFYVTADVGAIPEENLWTLIRTLWGFVSAAELDTAIAARKAASEARHAQAQKDLAAVLEKCRAMKSKFAQSFQKKRLHTVPTAEGRFLRLEVIDGAVVPVLYVLQRRGPRLCFARQSPRADKLDCSAKMRAVMDTDKARWQHDLDSGFLFAA